MFHLATVGNYKDGSDSKIIFVGKNQTDRPQKIKHLFHWCTRWKMDRAPLSYFGMIHGGIDLFEPRTGGWRGQHIREYHLEMPWKFCMKSHHRFSLYPNLISLWMRIRLIGFGNNQGSTQQNQHMPCSQVQAKSNGGTIWKLKCPETVRIFIYLLLKGRLLTRDVMARSNCDHCHLCDLCDACSLETAMHLFFECPYVSQVWFHAERTQRSRFLVLGDSIQNTGTSLRIGHRSQMHHK